MGIEVREREGYRGQKERGIEARKREGDRGGPEGKETTSNICHIYGFILTLPSQISTLSPPPPRPLSPTPSNPSFACEERAKREREG